MTKFELTPTLYTFFVVVYFLPATAAAHDSTFYGTSKLQCLPKLMALDVPAHTEHGLCCFAIFTPLRTLL
jgi:hypothetical protein